MRSTKMVVILVFTLALPTEVAKADFTFGTPTNLGPTVNSAYREKDSFISIDSLSLYFASNRPGTSGERDIWVTTRATTEDDWGTPVNLGPPINSQLFDASPCISADGLEFYFMYKFHPNGFGYDDIWVSRRQSKDDPWGDPVNLGSSINTWAADYSPRLAADGLELYFNSTGHGGFGKNDIFVSRRATVTDDWGPPINLDSAVNSQYHEISPSISADGLCLFFSDHEGGPYRVGGHGGGDIWISTLHTSERNPEGYWGESQNLGPIINSSHIEAGPYVSADGRVLFFHSNRPGGFGDSDIYEASIIPIVDFNGDGIVDSADMCIIVDHWGTDDPLCDIGPMPWGDGIVDVQDLIVLAEHLFTYPGALAYWKLDETEGFIAQDSAGYNDAYISGDPVWQSTGGMVDGAIQLDGLDDCVITGSIPNPTEGPFSVFAWIKGGAPGQAVLSQMGGARWLCADPSDGNLMTELKGTGRDATELLSQTIIIDGNWHRIALVWDGSHRTLYVDDVVVAEDAQDNLEASENGLYIGTGTAMEPGSFWSGLIDNVRIYNRAVTP